MATEGPSRRSFDDGAAAGHCNSRDRSSTDFTEVLGGECIASAIENRAKEVSFWVATIS